ncbi:MAG: peroxiredoxin family protein, partial [Desulfobulbia bacterium]
IRETRNLLGAAGRTGDKVKQKELSDKNARLNKELVSYPYDFIEEHSDNDFSLLLLETLIANQNQDLAKVKSSLSSLSSVVNKSAGNQNIGKKVQGYIVQREAVANVDIGKIAPDFSAPMPDGKALALNDIKGKATIIDFWASWCGPCRRENPNVVRVYEKYHDKGLEIISVSLDKPNQKQRWLDAIKKDRLNWHHVSNLNYFNDPVARLYNVNAIPATFILDEDGRIVAKKLRGQALEDQISSMLK